VGFKHTPCLMALLHMLVPLMSHAAPVAYTDAQLKLQVTSLPGAPSVPWKMFSGYIRIPGRGRIFYWFVESQGASPLDDPLLLWTNGGPGCSGLIGFLTENSPFRPTAAGNLTLNPYAWNGLANMVYVEQPVGVGYSVADGVLSYGDASSAADNLEFVKGFFAAFPQYKASDFYLTSESYGGHYLPTLSAAIVGDGGITNFRGFLVGNPITWLTYTNYGMYGTFHGHQLLPKPLWDEYVAADCRNAPGLDPGPTCANITARMDELTKHLDPYGLDFPKCNDAPLANGGRHERWTMARATRPRDAQLGYYPYFPRDYQPCTADWATTYLSRKDVQQALHAQPGGPTWAGNWSACANIAYSQQDVAAPMMPVYKKLLGAKPPIRMVIMSGDDDSVCATLGTQQFIWDLGRPIKHAWAPWFLEDGPACPGPACKQVGGYAVGFDGISLVTVHGAGHLAPATRPAQAFHVLKTFLGGGW